MPMTSLEVGRWEIGRLQTVGQPRCASCAARLKMRRVLSSGANSTCFDANRFELVDDHLVAGQPRLCLHDAVQSVEEPRIIGNSRVEQYIDRIDKRWYPGGSQRRALHPNAFAIGDCVGDVTVSGTAIVRPQQRIRLLCRRWWRSRPVGDVAVMVGMDRYLPPAPLSAPSGPTSSIAVCQQSSIRPTMTPVSAGGISITTGPTSLVSKNGMK